MRRKKSEVDATKQTLVQEEQGIILEPKHHATPEPSEGVIDLDPETKTVYTVPAHVGETVRLQPEQHATGGVKAKRKYTKRAKKNVGQSITPTLIDRSAIRGARIQTFIDYVDGKIDFQAASNRDSRLVKLDTLALELENKS